MDNDYGIVIDLIGNRARVRVEMTAACKHCKSASICIPEGGMTKCLTAIAPEWVKVGQKVKLELPSSSQLFANFLVYIVPLGDMFIGAILGYFLGKKYFPNQDPQQIAAGLGFLFLILSFAVMRILNSYFEKSGMFMPKIVEVVKENSKTNF